MQQEILNRIDALAAELGVAAENIYEVLIRQAKFEALELVLSLPFLIFLWAAAVWFAKKGHEADHSTEDAYFFPFFFLALLSIVLTIVWLVKISTLPTLLFNPEYWALNEILSAFGN